MTNTALSFEIAKKKIVSQYLERSQPVMDSNLRRYTPGAVPL
jgi:hypothetical protein